MLRRTLVGPLAALAFLASPLASQEPAQQSKSDSLTAAQVSQAAATLLAQAQADGNMAAMNVGTGGWFAGGLVSGVLLGLIGTGVSWAVAANSNVDLPPDKRLLITSQPITYQQVYEKSFGDKVKSKRRSSALTGGLLGTATFVLIYLSASSGS
jgi:hypothetical protein